MLQAGMRVSAAIETAHEDVSTLLFTFARPLKVNKSLLIAAVIFKLNIL